MRSRSFLSSFLGALIPHYGPLIDIPTNPEVLESEYRRLKREALQVKKFPSRKRRLRDGLVLQSAPSKPQRINYMAVYRRLRREKRANG
jgi:hypothetical protein